MRMAALLSCALLGACAVVSGYRDTDVRMTSLASFDAARYAGRWVEVARFPTPFQAGCEATSATYGPPVDGVVSVRNACRKADGSVETIRGTAEVVGPGRLKVRLAGVPVAADYWVLWADDSYETAVVGVPSGRAGWILAREAEIRADRLAAAKEVFAFNGYDTAALVYGAGDAP